MTDDLHPFLARLAEHGAYEPPSRPYRAPNGLGGPVAPAGDPQAVRYAAAALESESSRVAQAPEGTRNHELNRGAYRMRQLVDNGWLTEQTVFDALVDAGQAAGLGYVEAERTVLSGLGARTGGRGGVELHPAGGAEVAPAYVVDDPGALAGGAQPGISHDVGSVAAQRPRLTNGGVFMLDNPATVPAVWGDGDDVLWAAGEPLLITGPTGVGKTTLGTSLIAGRMGLIPDALGYTIEPGRRVLLFAMDRPRQIARAMARLLRKYPRDVLNERLIVWQGPPPMDIGRHPHVLLNMAREHQADTVVLDSLKDAAIKLSDEEVGHGLSRAMNMCVSEGIEVLGYHHQTKRGAGGIGKPNSIADVYGSSWITAGAGSILLIWGSPGDLVVELSHLKQPADIVGPLSIGFDHTAGHVFLYDGMSEGDKLVDLLRSGPQSAATIASWLSGPGAEAPDRATVARVQRRLERLVTTGVATRRETGGPPVRLMNGQLAGKQPAKYALVAPNHAATSHPNTSRRAEQQNPRSDRITGQRDLGIDLTEARDRSHRSTPNDVFPGQTESRTEAHRAGGPPKHASPPPFMGGDAGGAGGLKPSHEMELEVEVCARCHQPAARFIPAPDGRRWCPRCAYPTEPQDQQEED